LHLSRFKIGGIAVGLVAIVGAAACGSGGGGGQSSALAASQVLKFPIFGDFGTLDPGLADAEVDTEISQNIFNGLIAYDKTLAVVPDIATAVPTAANGGISADGLTYTFHLRQDVTFSNGDKVTSKDVLYSWNRAAALQGAYSGNLAPVAGFAAVQAAAQKPPKSKAAASDKLTFQQNIENQLAAGNPAFQMTGLTAPDAYTVVAKLASPAGWFLSAAALQGSTGMIVDESVIKNDPRDWWTKPTELVGTGSFMETAYTPKQSVVFKPVANWWGSPKPTLTEIDVDIKDPSTESTSIAQWEQNGYDLVGYGGYSTLPTADILRIHGSSSEQSQLTLEPKGRTTWVSFNTNGDVPAGGPFVSLTGHGTPTANAATAKTLRMAFALAVDKNGLANTVCHNLVCAPATGGLITKGLIGYGGDNTDPLAKFDPTMAMSLLKQADPTGTLTANLKYSYNAGGLNDPVATYLQDQWKTNLGLNVSLDPQPDASAFIANRLGGKYQMSRDGWQFDYNHPQDWYDNLWGKAVLDAGANTSGYDSSTYDATLAKADAMDVQSALPLYNQLAKELQDNVVYVPLYYSVGQFLIHPYVQGAGSNTQADFYWDGISLLQH
jgi:oligopeptide transport system substrate-binding protein